jgi:hypothetical protein
MSARLAARAAARSWSRSARLSRILISNERYLAAEKRPFERPGTAEGEGAYLSAQRDVESLAFCPSASLPCAQVREAGTLRCHAPGSEHEDRHSGTASRRLKSM